MSAPEPRTPWWQLVLLAVLLVGVEWLVEYRADSAAHDAALRAADAAADSARIQLDARGPREARGDGWYVDAGALDISSITEVAGFDLRVSTDASACPISGAEVSVLGDRQVGRGYVKVGDRWFVARCDPMLDRHGQVGGLFAVVAEARGFAGNPWRVRMVLVPVLLGVLVLAAAQLVQSHRLRLALWTAEQTIDEQNARNQTAAVLLRERDDELESEANLVDVARGDADAANREKTSFLSNVSHELQTPLNAVIGYGELLQEEVAPSHREDVRRLLQAARGLVDTIGEILELTRIEDGAEITVQAFDLRGLLEDLGHASRPRLEQRGNTLRLEVDPGIDWMVGDPGRLGQLLDKLLFNANGLSGQGREGGEGLAEPSEIVLLAYPFVGDGGTERVAFQVTDSGVGMDEETVARVFEPFGVPTASVGHRYVGTGVGLTIVKRLTEQLGGDVSAASTPGVGTTFTVVLPKELHLTTG